MWADNPKDTVNVNERVIVSAEDIAANGGGTWEVRVRSRNLATDSQSYSLVVTGPISPPASTSDVVAAAAVDDDEMEESAALSIVAGSTPFLLSAASALAAVLFCA